MKSSFLILICLLLSSCYVYRPLEVAEDQEIPSLKEQLQKDKFYTISSQGEEYKIKAVQWQGDSLVAHVNLKEDQEMKFHKNDISTVNHRVFSRGRSDALTVGAYAGVIGLIFFLTQ